MKQLLSEAQARMKVKHSTPAGRSTAAAEAKSVDEARARLLVKRELRAAKVIKRRIKTARKLYLVRKQERKQMNKAMKEEWRALEQTWRTLQSTIREAEESLRRATAGSKATQEAEALGRGYRLGVEHQEKLQNEKGHTRQ
jgi:predicted component of type VI protein secretion system